jgi:transaldolase
VWEETRGNDGYVSFELDPLLDAADSRHSDQDRTEQYIQLAREWSAGHDNRMIKVPATPAGLAALEEISAAGVMINVTLIFSLRQYREARDAIWKGARRRKDPQSLKSVYSIFISRIDVYTQKQVPELSDRAQGEVGLLNVKRIWKENNAWWADKNLPRQQEIVFASTGTKLPEDPKDKYVAALVGSDIQTNPPETNEAVEKLGRTYTRTVDKLPTDEVQREIDEKVDFERMERTLMEEGLQKFSDPQEKLIELIGKKRAQLAASA